MTTLHTSITLKKAKALIEKQRWIIEAQNQLIETLDKMATGQAARTLSRLGASKGGVARASALTPQQRSWIARKAVRARWAKKR